MSQKATFLDEVYGPWEATPASVVKDHGHPERGKDLSRLSLEEVKERLPKHITIVDSTYINVSTKCKFFDKDYGEWEVIPQAIFQGHQHPARANLFTKVEEFTEKLFGIKKFDKTPHPEIRLRPDFKLRENLFLDCHGLYWHSEAGSTRESRYHFRRREIFEECGLRLLQFYEDEIFNKTKIVKSVVDNLMGRVLRIGARKLLLREVPMKEANRFLFENHLMGTYQSGRFVGLFRDDELLMTLGYRPYHDLGTFELTRVCSKIGWQIQGGFSKCLKFVLDITNPTAIVSFVDLRYGDGHSLMKFGFKEVGTSLGWRWTDLKTTFNRLTCRANMDERKLSEREHAKEKGWYKIFDAGQRLFRLTLK
jgi:hypothetical protein